MALLWFRDRRQKIARGYERGEGAQPGDAMTWLATVARDRNNPDVWWLNAAGHERVAYDDPEEAIAAADRLHDAGRLGESVP